MRGCWQMAARLNSRIRSPSGAVSSLLAVVICVIWIQEAFSSERPLTVDDILKLSHVGHAAARPGSDAFVWEQSPPYDTLSDFGAGTTGTWQGSDFEIHTLESHSTVPKRLFQPRAGTTYTLGDFSSGGRFLTLLACRDGVVRAAVFDFQRQRLREFPLAPRFFGPAPGPDWTWLDNHRLVMSVYPDGEGPWQFTFRRAIGTHLARSWERSWKGKEPSVDQFDSSANDVARPLPGRLVLVDVVSGRIQQLASGQFSALHVSPDGRWLATVRQSMLPQSTLDKPQLDWVYARSALAVFSLAEGFEERAVAPELDVLPDSIQWSPSSKAVAFYASHAGAGLRSGQFYLADPSSAEAKSLSHDGLSLVSQRARFGAQWPERAVWFDNSLAVFARSTPGEAGTLAYEDIVSGGVVDPRVAVTSLPAHWFLLSSAAAPRDLTPGMDKVAPVPLFADGVRFAVAGDGQAWELHSSAPPKRLFPEFSRRLDAVANQDMFKARTSGGQGLIPVVDSPSELARIDVDHGSLALRLIGAPPETSILAVSKSDSMLAQIGVGKGAKLALVRPGSGPQVLEVLNPLLDQIAETRWIDFPYSNAGGSTRDQLSGCLLLPTDYHPSGKYPLIVEVYPDRPGHCGGPRVRARYAMATLPTSYSEHLLAARGYIVFRPDTGGGISRTADGPQAALPAVVDSGVDAVLAAGFGDPARVGLMGFSQGGFASLWVATQSRKFKAVVSLNGWTDLASDFFSMPWSQQLVPTEMPTFGSAAKYLLPAGTDWYMGGTPWGSPNRYVANSALWRSDTVSAPVLLIHADLEEFELADYKNFFTSLYMQKKDARLLIYRGEGHSPSSPANIKHMWQNIFSWFDKYLRVTRDPTGKIILDE